MDPKRRKFYQNFDLSHVIWAHMGPARALEESVGLARALEEQDKFRKNAPLFVKHIFTKNKVSLQTSFFGGFNMLLSFLAEK